MLNNTTSPHPQFFHHRPGLLASKPLKGTDPNQQREDGTEKYYKPIKGSGKTIFTWVEKYWVTLLWLMSWDESCGMRCKYGMVCVDSKHTHHRDGGPNPFYFGCRNNRTNSLTDHAECHMFNTMQAGQNQLNQMDPLHDSMMMKQNDAFLDLFKAYV